MRSWGAPKREPVKPPLCSGCDPEIGKWHGEFEQRSAEGMIVGADGFLYYPEEFQKKQVYHTSPRGQIVDGQEVPVPS